MAAVTDDAAHLVAILEPYRERLHALPGVVGSGVGLREGQPVIEISVAGYGDDELEREIREIVDFDYVIVTESQPAEAQSPADDAKE